MTARHQIRVGGRRLGRDRAPIDATPAPEVGELLRVARERKGVDIYRAERDTKIRAKHLEALETGDYGQLPGAVYIKGFLRNYASYLGLDPEEVIERWRDETSSTRRTEAVAVAPPRPLAEPRRGLTFTPGILVAAVLTVVVLAFAAYIGLQVARFNQTTTVTVTGALVMELAPDAESYVLEGQTLAAATVRVTGPGGYTGTTEADAEGAWSIEVPLTKGRNDFTIIATDPVTDEPSSPVNVIVTVPVPATASPPAGSEAPTAPSIPPATLALTAPVEGAVISGESVAISGTTDGTSVVVTATYLGAPGGSPEPSVEASPSPVPSEVAPTPAAPAPLELTVAEGAFTGELTLPLGRWTVTVTASAEGRSDAVQTRTVELAFDGLVVVIEARHDAWIVGWEDGRRARGTGIVLPAGESLTLTAERTVVVTTGNSGGTLFTVNGEELGSLGPAGAVEAWLFEKGKDPRPAP